MDAPENTVRPSTLAGSEANGRNVLDPHRDDLAEWISGAQWADEVDVDPDCGIGAVLGANAWKAVRKFCRRHGIEANYPGADGMAFSDFEAVPREVWHTARPAVEPTRAQVAEFAEDAMTEDPHKIGKRLKRERSQRFRSQDRTKRELKTQGIPTATLYTFDGVAAVHPDVAAEARELVDRYNRRAWNSPKPHTHREHEHLITAEELHSGLGVPAADIARMAPATDADKDRALEDLAVARRRHQIEADRRAKAGDSDPDDGPLYADIGRLLDGGMPETPKPDILRRTDDVGLFYRAEINLLYGDPEDGKTMIALAACAQVLTAGGVALFVDLDDNGVASILSRLLMLGAPESALRERFRYCCPSGPDRLVEAIEGGTVEGRVPDVVIIDCVGELVPMFGGSNDSADDFTRIIRTTGGPLARAGACVVLIDHMAKNSDSRRYGAGGTMAKRRRVGGTQLRVIVEAPLRKGQGGSLWLGIRKDRHSGLRQHCPAAPDTKDALQPAGTFIIDPGDVAWSVAVDPMVISARAGSQGGGGKHSRYVDAAQLLGDRWTITELTKRVHGEKFTPAQRKQTERMVKDMAVPGGCIDRLTTGAQYQPATYRFIGDP